MSGREVVRLGLLLVLLSPSVAWTADAGAAAVSTSSGTHSLAVYGGGGAMAYLSGSRTMGGLGGGLGIRDTVSERFILQGDVSYLGLIGHVVAFRAAAGVQLSGLYAPAVLASLTVLAGQQLSFLSPEHPEPLRFPAVSIGLVLAPLRFSDKGMHISVLELGLGVGTELPGLGLSYQLTILQVGVSL